METQEIIKARSMEHLLRTVAGSEWSQPERETVWATAHKTVGAVPPKPLGAHAVLSRAQMLDTELRVCLESWGETFWRWGQVLNSRALNP